MVNYHRDSPFHCIEVAFLFSCFTGIWSLAQVWDLEIFMRKTSLQVMGLIVQLGHPHGEACAYPCPSGRQVVVIDIEGIHKVNVWFCGCHRARPLYVQMLRARWFPATVELPRTAVTFAVLQHFQMMTFMSKVSGYEYYHSLVRLMDNTGVQPPPVRGSLFVHFPSMDLMSLPALRTFIKSSWELLENGVIFVCLKGMAEEMIQLVRGERVWGTASSTAWLA